MPAKRAPTKRRPKPKPTAYVVFWWQNQVPYAAIFHDEIAAYAAASVRNAFLIELEGKDWRISKAVDYYRRDDKGNPMPVEWRDVIPPIGLPWMMRSNPTDTEVRG